MYGMRRMLPEIIYFWEKKTNYYASIDEQQLAKLLALFFLTAQIPTPKFNQIFFGRISLDKLTQSSW